ncbi:Trypsin-like cysteine/serine peptidase domain [Pseudocohnilembus persalinus]|uniref:Trypsin-like cysteine/serine peptidase domain n=1 Tax=Pseudocohnilembus persalinus TaxID=266149 RepID=A0A0V0QLM1_PSEPJ|nr:Trypsin-like cysteine/serine peptidase domain [Pseudocohnilembus persalinus]|eukprot:KRX03126.1 Trypsin-like cysteine/serine peptidase domain [Pseudocohnilembus persalinus]
MKQLIKMKKRKFQFKKINFKKPVNIKLLINSQKSIGLGKIIDFSQFILCYEGTTACGSSGSPVIDQNGNLLGINTGSFDDITENEKVSKVQNLGLISFDVQVPENR